MKWLTRSAVMAAVVLLSGASAVARLTAIANWDGGPAVDASWEAGAYPAWSGLPPGPGLDWRIGTGEATQAFCGYPQEWAGQPYPNSDGVGKWGGALWDGVDDGMLYTNLQNGDAKELVDAQGTIEFWFKPEWDPIKDTNTHTLINLNNTRPADDGLWFRYNGDGTMTSVVKDWPHLREVGHEWVGLFFGRDHGDVDGAGTYEADGLWDSFAIWDEVRYSGDICLPPTGPIVRIQFTGDRNDDGFVGQADVDIVLAMWGKSGVEISDLRADVNGDELVRQTDLDYVLADWGQGE